MGPTQSPGSPSPPHARTVDRPTPSWAAIHVLKGLHGKSPGPHRTNPSCWGLRIFKPQLPLFKKVISVSYVQLLVCPHDTVTSTLCCCSVLHPHTGQAAQFVAVQPSSQVQGPISPLFFLHFTLTLSNAAMVSDGVPDMVSDGVRWCPDCPNCPMDALDIDEPCAVRFVSDSCPICPMTVR